MMHVGDIMSTMGVFSIVGDINEYHGVLITVEGYHHACGGISRCMWRDILSTVGGVQYCGMS